MRENLEMGSYRRGRANRKRNLERVFDIFPRLRERSGQNAGTLSGGEQQMLAIGRGMMAEPDLLILDEPSLGLSPLLVEEMFALIEKLRNNGMTLLLVEQNVVQSLEIASRAYIIEDGMVTLSGTPAEIAGNTELKRAYRASDRNMKGGCVMGLTPASVMLAEPAPARARTWSDFAGDFDLRRAEPALIARARLVLLDCIGAIAAGMQEPEARALAARLARTPGDGIAVGAGLRLHGGDAAFLNGVAGTMLELDEGNSFARGHPGIHVLPALLSGIGGAGLDGIGFLRAFVLGYEAGARVGTATRLRPAIHPHGTWGVIGAAVAAAAAEGAGGRDIVRTMNVSAALGPGSSLRAMLEGVTVRNAYAGVAARNGLYAWDLVASGFTGETDALRSVYSGVLAEAFDAATMTGELGTRWEIRRNYFKRHAACRFTHGALDVLAELIARHGPFDPDAVARIEVESYAMAAQLDAPAPPTMLAAKFSVPFAVATMLVHGAASVSAFRPRR
ncbi:MAG: MmgE/PrpD family protein [Roseovarius sp.]|nr:MmgE/PrpD family protein [Roseovarius sp.]